MKLIRSFIKEPGFTLIELLIAVSIFSVVAVALYSSFNAGIRVWRRAEENMELHQAVRLAFEGLAKELRNAIFFGEEVSEDTSKPEGQIELAEKPELAFIGARKEITFMTQVDRLTDEGEFQRELAKIKYALEEDTKITRLVSFQGEGFDEALSGSSRTDSGDSGKEILIEGIEELVFEYSYENEDEESEPVWKDYWEDQQGLPLGVKARLKVRRKEGAAGEFFKTVFIPTGILGKEGELGEETERPGLSE